MSATLILKHLLEDDDDADFAKMTKTCASRWRNDELHSKMLGIDDAVRRVGDGYSDQWDIHYLNWLFTVSFYEDGVQLWSAHYKTPTYDWSTPEEKEQGYGWSGGGDIRELDPGADPKEYLQRLKAMADKYPNPFGSRHVPNMPNPDSKLHGY